jgi:hypothetical protein
VKRALCSAGGVVIAAVVSYYVVSAAGELYNPHFESDEQIGNFMMGGLVFQAICMIAGGWLGYRVTRPKRRAQGLR